MTQFDRLAELEAARNMSAGDKVRAAAKQINAIKAGFLAERAKIYGETRDWRTAEAEVNVIRRRAKEDLQKIVDATMPAVKDNLALSDELYYSAQNVENYGSLERLAMNYDAE